MNGAESLVHTLVDGGINVCFANPGTSEMHFVAALDRVEGMRSILCLFEGVVTGAADGYARMTDKPAATLLHLGPGLANGAANLHNAKKANSPIVNVIGEHATYHIAHDAPLTADIEGMARPVSHWVRTSLSANSVASDAAQAMAAAMAAPGQIASLILPANTAWEDATGPATLPAIAPRAHVKAEAVATAAEILRSGESTVLLLGGLALRGPSLELAGRIANATGARVMAQGANSRIERGAGRVAVNRIPFAVDQALQVLDGVKNIILIGAKAPVAFFAYPGKPSELSPPGCKHYRLASMGDDLHHTLTWLADEIGATTTAPTLQPLDRPAIPDGPLSKDSIAAVLGALIPENAIIADESVTTGRDFFRLTAGAPAHCWMNNTGGSIGLGMPLATGAAVACPDRKVICLSGDGSAMYTVQSLWTQARENLDVTTVVFSNRSYEILLGELAKVGAGNAGRSALDMLDLRRPDLDFVMMAKSMGVPGTSVNSNASFAQALTHGLATAGPYMIDVELC
ncbi:MAG: acetolactate synthase-1/2/3 large subunit [Gammaproteobacteria bacterium]|jgi:acetolactate synthase-1/2/3 large subunit